MTKFIILLRALTGSTAWAAKRIFAGLVILAFVVAFANKEKLFPRFFSSENPALSSNTDADFQQLPASGDLEAANSASMEIVGVLTGNQRVTETIQTDKPNVKIKEKIQSKEKKLAPSAKQSTLDDRKSLIDTLVEETAGIENTPLPLSEGTEEVSASADKGDSRGHSESPVEPSPVSGSQSPTGNTTYLDTPAGRCHGKDLPNTQLEEERINWIKGRIIADREMAAHHVGQDLPAASPLFSPGHYVLVQAALNDLGYDTGGVNGKFFDETKAALMKWRLASGSPNINQDPAELKLTFEDFSTLLENANAIVFQGERTRRELDQLNIALEQTLNGEHSNDAQFVEAVQTLLLAEGFDPGPIDGIWARGGSTERAIINYQSKRCLGRTGLLSSHLLDELLFDQADGILAAYVFEAGSALELSPNTLDALIASATTLSELNEQSAFAHFVYVNAPSQIQESQTGDDYIATQASITERQEILAPAAELPTLLKTAEAQLANSTLKAAFSTVEIVEQQASAIALPQPVTENLVNQLAQLKETILSRNEQLLAPLLDSAANHLNGLRSAIDKEDVTAAKEEIAHIEKELEAMQPLIIKDEDSKRLTEQLSDSKDKIQQIELRLSELEDAFTKHVSNAGELLSLGDYPAAEQALDEAIKAVSTHPNSGDFEIQVAARKRLIEEYKRIDVSFPERITLVETAALEQDLPNAKYHYDSAESQLSSASNHPSLEKYQENLASLHALINALEEDRRLQLKSIEARDENRALLSSIREAESQLEADRNALDSEWSVLEEQRGRYKNSIREFERQSRRVEKEIDQITDDRDYFERQLRGSETEIAELKNEMQQWEKDFYDQVDRRTAAEQRLKPLSDKLEDCNSMLRDAQRSGSARNSGSTKGQ